VKAASWHIGLFQHNPLIVLKKSGMVALPPLLLNSATNLQAISAI